MTEEKLKDPSDWMNHPSYDEIHDQLKQEGYSTGSDGDYDKLMAELKRRILLLNIEHGD